jgi:hypothetical protein
MALPFFFISRYNMTHASSTILLHTPAEVTWQVIGDFGAACQYLVRIVHCTVEGVGVGALRSLTSADGSVIVERLEVLDETAYRLSYVLMTDTPFRDCLTTVRVQALDQGQCEVTWSATFEADGLPASEAAEMLAAALAANCLALKQLLER